MPHRITDAPASRVHCATVPTPPAFDRAPNAEDGRAHARRAGHPSAAIPLALGLTAVAFMAFAYRAMFANAPVWDDRYLVTGNPFVLEPGRLGYLLTHDLWTASAQDEPSSYYRPVTMLSYWLNARIGGASVASFHAGSLLVHVAVAALLVLFSRRSLTSASENAPLSWMAPAVAGSWFALAPATSEGVLWTAGRFDPLGTLLTLAALLCNVSDRPARIAATLTLCAGALFAKESFAIIPLLLLGHDVIVCRRGWRAIVAKYVALAAIVGAYLVIRRALGIVSLDVVSTTGATSLARSFAWMAALIVGLALFPVRLDPFRRYDPFGTPGTVAAFLALIAVSGLVILLVTRRRAERAPRLVAFGWFAFLVALAPVTVTGPNLGIVGDRYAYFPAVALALMLAGLVALARAEGLARGAPRRLIVAASGLLVLVLALQARRIARRVLDWRDERTLTEATLRADPNAPEALYQLGQIEALAGRLTEADALLSHADREQPSYWRVRTAICYLRLHQDRLPEAEAACLDAVRLNPTNPRAFSNLSATYIRMRDWPRGLAAARQALAVKPRYAEAHYEAALCLANLGRRAEAEAEARAALAVAPEHRSAHDLLAQLERAAATR